VLTLQTEFASVNFVWLQTLSNLIFDSPIHGVYTSSMAACWHWHQWRHCISCIVVA